MFSWINFQSLEPFRISRSLDFEFSFKILRFRQRFGKRKPVAKWDAHKPFAEAIITRHALHLINTCNYTRNGTRKGSTSCTLTRTTMSVAARIPKIDTLWTLWRATYGNINGLGVVPFGHLHFGARTATTEHGIVVSKDTHEGGEVWERRRT